MTEIRGLKMYKIFLTIMLVALNIDELVVVAQQGTYTDNPENGANVFVDKLITIVAEQVGEEFVTLAINVSTAITDFMLDWNKENEKLG